MSSMTKITYLALITAVVGLIILTYASERVNPPKASISDLTQADVGKSVRVEGTVESIHFFKGGSALLTLASGDSRIGVYLPYKVSVSANASSLKGLTVDAVGTVNVYDGQLELVVEDSKRLRILK